MYTITRISIIRPWMDIRAVVSAPALSEHKMVILAKSYKAGKEVTTA